MGSCRGYGLYRVSWIPLLPHRVLPLGQPLISLKYLQIIVI